MYNVLTAYPQTPFLQRSRYKQYMGALGITLWAPHEGIQDSQRAWTPDQTNKMSGSLLMILDMDQNPQDILGK